MQFKKVIEEIKTENAGLVQIITSSSRKHLSMSH